MTFNIFKAKRFSSTAWMVLVFLFLNVSCQKSNDSFSLLAEQSTFKQSTSYQTRKIDILWVIDNSGSMKSSQDNVIANFNSFIQRFQTLNYDFNMAFISTDAYLDQLDTSGTYKNTYCPALPNKSCSLFRDGPGKDKTATLHSGIRVLNKSTPGLTSVFNLNAAGGIQGYGDERGLQSLKVSLSNTSNTDFRRSDAFLAIIIVSDEDDFSQNVISPHLEDLSGNAYLTDSRIHPISDYITFLDSYTNSTATIKNYSVNAITILDDACLAELNATNTSRRIGTRYAQVADQTNGIKASLCGNFGESLEIISDKVLALTSSFQLDREPIHSTILVKVDGTIIAENNLNGWSYDATNFTVNFHGSAIPAADASISITFDPVTVK